MLKEIAIELADLTAEFCERRARKWVRRSKWWSDVAESIETGASMSEIQQRSQDEKAV